MIAVVLGILAAAANATASVLQRRGARKTPEEEALRPALIVDLMRRPVWLAGIGALIVGFLLQAAALGMGALALVEPLLAAEMPFTLLAAALLNRVRIGRREWLPTLGLSVGLALLLFALSPSAAHNKTPPAGPWVIGAAATVGTVVVLLLTGRRKQGPPRATLFGVAAGIGFGFTAALMKGMTERFAQGFLAIFISWQLYGMVAAGILSVFLLQNALQAGTVVAAQPAFTISDPMVSIAYGVALFAEDIRLGGWIALELAGVALVVAGAIRLAGSPLVSGAAPHRYERFTRRRGQSSRPE